MKTDFKRLRSTLVAKQCSLQLTLSRSTSSSDCTATPLLKQNTLQENYTTC